mmetsp:Transcript_16794/g.34212  ORF Transcript_16794/g.34212 Transcript_16794/m.34212 type:complete len:278 (-) Transcript_16794:44-877(-)
MTAFCSCLGIPPYRHTTFTPTPLAAASHTAQVCNASSRVGATTSIMGLCLLGGAFPQRVRIPCKPGKAKARVFPDPVSASPIMSRPASKMGQHWAWIGVGAVKPLQLACTTFWGSRGSLKLKVGKISSEACTFFSSRHACTAAKSAVLMSCCATAGAAEGEGAEGFVVTAFAFFVLGAAVSDAATASPPPAAAFTVLPSTTKAPSEALAAAFTAVLKSPLDKSLPSSFLSSLMPHDPSALFFSCFLIDFARLFEASSPVPSSLAFLFWDIMERGLGL